MPEAEAGAGGRQRRKVIFAGTPDFAVPMLRMLASIPELEVVAVLSQPDRPAGRGKLAQASPVKRLALELGLTVLQPVTLRDPEIQQQLALLHAELMIVVAYGLILPKRVLELPSSGCWNVHASLLPRWRGAAPIQRAIAAGDVRTGVGLMQMEAGLDTGPILLESETAIGEHETGGELHDRLATMGTELLARGVRLWLESRLPAARVQSEQGVCYAHKLEKEEGILDWNQAANELVRKIRAYWPWPSVSLPLDGQRVQVAEAVVDRRALPASAHPGDLLSCGKEGIVIACLDAPVMLRMIKPAGARLMSAWDFANGRSVWKASAKGWT